jgi:hypothetical protein
VKPLVLKLNIACFGKKGRLTLEIGGFILKIEWVKWDFERGEGRV